MQKKLQVAFEERPQPSSFLFSPLIGLESARKVWCYSRNTWESQRRVGHSHNPRSEKVEAGGLSLRPTWLDIKIIKGSIWEEEIIMGRETGEERGGLRRKGDARTHRANTHLKVICLYLLAHDAMERAALETVLGSIWPLQIPLPRTTQLSHSRSPKNYEAGYITNVVFSH